MLRCKRSSASVGELCTYLVVLPSMRRQCCNRLSLLLRAGARAQVHLSRLKL